MLPVPFGRAQYGTVEYGTAQYRYGRAQYGTVHYGTAQYTGRTGREGGSREAGGQVVLGCVFSKVSFKEQE